MSGKKLLCTQAGIGQRAAVGLVALLALARIVERMVRARVGDEVEIGPLTFERGGERLADPRRHLIVFRRNQYQHRRIGSVPGLFRLSTATRIERKRGAKT